MSLPTEGKRARKFIELESYFCQSDEESLRKRQRVCKGSKFNCYEHMFAGAKDELNLADCPRKHFDGSTLSNHLGKIVWPEATAHEVSFGDKKKALNKAWKRVGGAGPATIDDHADKQPRTDASVEAFFFHQFPQVVMAEILHSFMCRQLLCDLTPGLINGYSIAIPHKQHVLWVSSLLVCYASACSLPKSSWPI